MMRCIYNSIKSKHTPKLRTVTMTQKGQKTLQEEISKDSPK